ncbi:hypothetical protein MASR1M68_14180 [Elusimicrobiota bacterium]
MMAEGIIKITDTVQIDKTSDVNNRFNIAQYTFRIGDYNEVENLCKRNLEIDSDHLPTWILRTQNAIALAKSRYVIQEHSKKVFEIDFNNFETSLFMARYELSCNNNNLAKYYYCKAVDCASDSEVSMIYEDVKKIATKASSISYHYIETIEDKANRDLIPALKLILERRRISQDLLKANFASSARATNILSVLEMREFISKPEGTNRWEINFAKIEEYISHVESEANNE